MKELAAIYSTSYPTLRKQMDKLIQKVRISERKANDKIIENPDDALKDGSEIQVAAND